MRKLVSLIFLIGLCGCAGVERDTVSPIRIGVIPASEKNQQVGGSVMTEIDVWANNDCYGKTYFVEPDSGDILFEQAVPYDCKVGPTGSLIPFFYYKDKKVCRISFIEMASGPWKDKIDNRIGCQTEDEMQEAISDYEKEREHDLKIMGYSSFDKKSDDIKIKVYPPYDKNAKYYNAVVSVGGKTKFVWFDGDAKEILESKNDNLTDGINEYKVFVDGKYEKDVFVDTTECLRSKKVLNNNK